METRMFQMLIVYLCILFLLGLYGKHNMEQCMEARWEMLFIQNRVTHSIAKGGPPGEMELLEREMWETRQRIKKECGK